MQLTDDSRAILAEIEHDAWDPDFDRETEIDVAAYWADMDAAIAQVRWEAAQEVAVDTYDPVPF